MLNELRETLESLLSIRFQENKWNDSENEPGLLRNLEAITCFGSPSYYYESLKIFDRRFEIVKIPEEVLIQDLKDILEYIERYGYPPSPYLDSDFKKWNIQYAKNKTDFVDTASFVISSMLDVLEYYEVIYKKECPFFDKIQNVTKEALAFLRSNAITEGENTYWTWGKKDLSEKYPSIYFTWTSTVALSYALKSKFSPLSDIEKDQIKSLLKGTLQWLINIIKEDPDYQNTRWRISYPHFGDTFSGRHEALMIYVGSMLDWFANVDIIVPKDLVHKIVATFINIYRNRQMWRLEGGGHLILLLPEITGLKESITLEYEDRSYEYVLISMLCYFYNAHNEKKIILSEEYIDGLDALIEELKNDLINDRDPKVKLWKKDGFLLYLTQRATEAMTTYLRYVYPYKVKEISLNEAVRYAVEDAIENFKKQIIETLSKNIESLLKRGVSKEKL